MEGPTPISASHPRRHHGHGRNISWSRGCRRCFEHSENRAELRTGDRCGGPPLFMGAARGSFSTTSSGVCGPTRRSLPARIHGQWALGASAYAASIFHLGTHAFFKALLFPCRRLGDHRPAPRAGHAPDGWGLRKYMPITWITSLVGTLALIGTPGFAGFFSKESIIEAGPPLEPAGQRGSPGSASLGRRPFVHRTLQLSACTSWCFHGKERMDEHARETSARKLRPW